MSPDQPPTSSSRAQAAWTVFLDSVRGRGERAAGAHSGAGPHAVPAALAGHAAQTARSFPAPPLPASSPISSPPSHAPFPAVSDAKLQSLFPAHADDPPGTPLAACVRAALVEMQLAAHLDPCVLDEKSDVSRGYWALAELVRRVQPTEDARDAPPPDARHRDGAEREAAADAATQPAARARPARARRYEVHDVYAAIDAKNVEALMAIRDADFELLLGGLPEGSTESGARTGGGVALQTPLGHAISLGAPWERVATVLVGAFSRYVNQLPDDGEGAPTATLRKVRTNLKLAIDHSLDREQTLLLASYLQVLVMAEGIAWVRHTARAVAHELHAWASFADAVHASVPRPVQVARDAVDRFLTANFRTRREREPLVDAAMQDYVANATGDLVLMALWDELRPAPPDGLAQDVCEPIPPYAFARDSRIAGIFCERMHALLAADGPPDAAPARARRLWASAQRVLDAFDSGLRPRTAGERLAALTCIYE
ncbi:hypothetical protein MSPP1_002458 [Malassezia sp. CBS 17886]|nr:hypothetical protein MSPP1_002458 [Malassezia sp. CBS 17886]